MSAPRLLLRLLGLAVAAVLALAVLGGGDDQYVVELRMANAGGLKDGSPVTIGGVQIGKVKMDVDTAADEAVARLEIEEEHAPVGMDATAVIAAQNVLGQKSVQIRPGDLADPAPSGTRIGEDRISESTDLDRVISVLDADTRTRLAVFVNEAGAAFTGREADFNRFLRDIAPAIGDATDVVEQLGVDNRRLGHLLETTDRFVAEVTARKGDVVAAIDSMGHVAETVATKRGELRSTLVSAPGAFDTLQSFLGELESATGPLGIAARRVSATADPLEATLAQLEPFRRAADPALREAVEVAPRLVELADRATPVLDEARPTLRRLARTSAEELPPLSSVIDRSLNNTLAVVENWAGAIQLRDQLSHIFRGEASFAPDALNSLLQRVESRDAGTRKKRKAPAATAPAPAPSTSAPAKEKPAVRLPGLPAIEVPDLEQTVKGTVDRTTGLLGDALGGGRRPSSPGSQQEAAPLLDYLLGG